MPEIKVLAGHALSEALGENLLHAVLLAFVVSGRPGCSLALHTHRSNLFLSHHMASLPCFSLSLLLFL